MAISGDLKALNLTELFQTLAGASQQGMLTVTDGAGVDIDPHLLSAPR